ncbi:MAG: SAM-dependent chlorinase/fluorinase [Salinivirgaceae bacterium]|jgi:S-adenosylmethionine hydrolase|nr:SAM-dependent chlorinase/fluorinase [Salinivirgaceae bacterium]
MSIITLTTDWHNDDFYSGAIKGLLYSKCQGVNVIDITHKIESFKYTQAAFVLRNAFSFYPEGTIHLIGINSDPTNDHPPICLKIKGQYFLGVASGIFSLMFSEKPDLIVKIEETHEMKLSSFPELTLFAEAASFLFNGGEMQKLGPVLENQTSHVQYMPAIDDNAITGNVIYIDSYQNIITNISKELFEQVRKKRSFHIAVKSDAYSTGYLSENYSEVEIGDILALFNSLGLLEIAMRNGRIAELIDIKINSPVTVKFR